MNKLIEENGGETAEIFDSTVTHIVSTYIYFYATVSFAWQIQFFALGWSLDKHK